jgi:hypothetical protein
MADGQYTSRRALLKGLPAAGVGIMLPQVLDAAGAETDREIDELLQSAIELGDGLNPYLGHNEYVVVKDAKVQRVLDAVRAVRLSGPSLGVAQPDPVVTHYREWVDARKEWDDLSVSLGDHGRSDPRLLAADEREISAQNEMLKHLPTSLEGIAALVAVAWYYTGPIGEAPESFENKIGMAPNQALTMIWRACTGRAGYPET